MKQGKAISLIGGITLALNLCLAVLAAHSPAIAESESGEKITVYTVNYPLKYFAQRIAGDRATVVFPAPPDVDPVFWMPDPETTRAPGESW